MKIFWSSYTYSVHFLQAPSHESSSENVPWRHFWHTVSCVWVPETKVWQPKKIQHISDTRLIALYIQCKRYLCIITIYTVPLDWAPYPFLQVLCGTQVKHSSPEQWNPTLHIQVRRAFVLSPTLTSKFLSERMDTSCVLCYIKQNSINIYRNSFV